MCGFEELLLSTEAVCDEKKEVPPFPSKTTLLKLEGRTLKREARISFHSEIRGTGLLNEHAEKDSVMVREFVISTWPMSLSVSQINLLVRELCFCKQDALVCWGFFDIYLFSYLFSDIALIFLGLICCCVLLCTLFFRTCLFGLLCRFSVWPLKQGSQGCHIKAAIQLIAGRKEESPW